MIVQVIDLIGGKSVKSKGKCQYSDLSTAAANAPPSVEMTVWVGDSSVGE
jgi:hypothetical protein